MPSETNVNVEPVARVLELSGRPNFEQFLRDNNLSIGDFPQNEILFKNEQVAFDVIRVNRVRAMVGSKEVWISIQYEKKESLSDDMYSRFVLERIK